jgi:hypothetical protein
MADSAFDALCGAVAREWDSLSPIKQWQLGSPEELRTSGYHIKATLLSQAWAAEVLRSRPEDAYAPPAAHHRTLWLGPKMPSCRSRGPWQWSEEHQVHWLNVGAFSLHGVRQ